MPDTAVLFASEYGRRDLTIPGVRRVELGTPKMKEGQGPRSPLRDAGRDLQMAYLRGNMTFNTLQKLKESGFVPDMICTTAVMGNSLFLRDVFPDSFLVVHAETYAPREDGPGLWKALGRTPQRVRNLLQINSLVECDLAVIATEWQRRGFPDWLGKGMVVLRPCVDTDFFSPDAGEKEPRAELTTFFGHRLETPSGLSRLLETLTALWAIRPACQVAVLASGVERTRFPAWERQVLAQVGEKAGQVRLYGFSSPDFYLQMLRLSSLYVYMPPFPALSAGLLESMSCGCLVLAPDTGPARETIREGENGFLCDFHFSASTAGRIADLLDRASGLGEVREAARRSVEEGYSLKRTMPENRNRLLRAYERWSNAGADI